MREERVLVRFSGWSWYIGTPIKKNSSWSLNFPQNNLFIFLLFQGSTTFLSVGPQLILKLNSIYRSNPPVKSPQKLKKKLSRTNEINWTSRVDHESWFELDYLQKNSVLLPNRFKVFEKHLRSDNYTRLR